LLTKKRTVYWEQRYPKKRYPKNDAKGAPELLLPIFFGIFLTKKNFRKKFQKNTPKILS